MDSRHPTWATSDRWVPQTFIRPFVRFSQIEASSGIVLLLAAVVALIWANSAASDNYFSLLEEPISLEFLGFHLEETLHAFINDGLMAVFFFVVGLEVKRELVLGDLSDPKAAALPVLAALGGMIFPALIFVFFNLGAGGEVLRGWGIPMATDIAFAVGVAALLASRVPPGAKLFLLAIAIADDIGAIAVIALFYTDDLHGGWLGAAVGGLLLVWVAARINIRALWFYVPMAFIIWYFTLESGVHATLAGVALGFITPARAYYRPREFDARARAVLDQFPLEPDTPRAHEHADHEALLIGRMATEAVAPLNRMERNLTAWSSYLIVPIFALANAGVDFRPIRLGEAATSTVALGIAVGLVAGKLIGISAFSFAAVRLGLGRLPSETTWSHVVGVAAVGGIGFTVSLFVTDLAFTGAEITDLAKVGIFAGSLAAGIIGSLILLRSPKRMTER
ncbi:MAG: Na+/H+ antiporter NhaA [Acidimicrobiia bacterium]